MKTETKEQPKLTVSDNMLCWSLSNISYYYQFW